MLLTHNLATSSDLMQTIQECKPMYMYNKIRLNNQMVKYLDCLKNNTWI